MPGAECSACVSYIEFSRVSVSAERETRTLIFRKAPARQASWRFLDGVPFRGSTKGGESERGRETVILEEGPQKHAKLLAYDLY